MMLTFRVSQKSFKFHINSLLHHNEYGVEVLSYLHMIYLMVFHTIKFDGLHIEHVKFDTISRDARFPLKVQTVH